MKVTKLVLRNFRNYSNLTLSFTNNINIFIGANAQGKTNLLEALYLGAMGRSHRAGNDSELIGWNATGASIDITFTRQDTEHLVGLRLIRDQQKNKEVLLNGHPIKNRELIGNLNAVLFSPEDLQLVKGAPALRRRFLDGEISQVSKAYYKHLLQYNRIIMQRNNLLKKIRERRAAADMLDTWDDQLAQHAAALVLRRREALKKIAMLANLTHRRITNSQENLAVVYHQPYVCPGDLDAATVKTEWYLQKTKEARSVDIQRGTTSVGPHRDDIVLTVNGVNLRTFGSQGQQRTGALALKLAELEFMKSEAGEYPILLLDDVMSELDAPRREHLMAFIKDRVQTFVTATDEEFFASRKLGKFYRVVNGSIRE